MDLVVLVLAVWRISYMLVEEDGPWAVFRLLRKRLRAGEFGGPTMDATRLNETEVAQAMMAAGSKRPMLGDLLSCVYCTSVWVALLSMAAYLLWSPTLWVFTALALSAGAIIIQEGLNRLR